jgi:hypothetical protein
VERDCLEHERHCDRHDVCDAVGDDAGALTTDL